MAKVIILETSRDCYDKREAIPYSISVGELIEILNEYDEDTKIILSNDGGYTYGIINEDYIDIHNYETYEEERLREKKEDIKNDIIDTEHDIAVLEKGREHWDEDDIKDYEMLHKQLAHLKEKLAKIA